jgi:hypothetical protein
MTTTLTFDAMDPTDTDYFVFNFADPKLQKGPLLAADDTIVSATIVTSVQQAPSDGSTPAALSMNGADIGPTADAIAAAAADPSTPTLRDIAAAQPLSRVTTEAQPGGTVGALYRITCQIVTGKGRALERSALLLVTDL